MKNDNLKLKKWANCKNFKNLGFLTAIFIFSFFIFNFKEASAAFKINRPPTLNSGLVGYWTFDGADTNFTTNTVTDKSGQGNNGTMINMSTSTARAPGKIGQALKFDGVDDYVDTADIPSSNILSVSLWLKGNSSWTENDDIIGKYGSSGNFEWRIVKRASDKGIYFQISDDGTSEESKNSTNLNIALGEWTHIVVRYDQGVFNIYKNGTQISDSGNFGKTSIFNGTNNLRIGDARLGSNFPGLIDEVRVYNRALSASEVKSLYNQGASKFNKTPTGTLTNGLVGYWTFDGADTNFTTNSVTDRSGNGNTGAMINMSTSTARAPGKIGQALKFDGSNTYIESTSFPTLTNNSFTISAWIYANSITGSPTVVSDGSGSQSSGYALNIQNNKLNFYSYNGANQQLNGITTLEPKKWYHVVAVWTKDLKKELYLNGISEISTNTNVNITEDDTGLRIGKYSNSFPLIFPGLIDEVRIYNRALSASEVKMLYNMGR